MARKNILVPVDGSSSSLRALEFAVTRIRRDEKTRLLVLNVQLPLPASQFVTRDMIAEFTERQSAEALGPAQKAAKRLRVAAEFHLEKGEPAEVIEKFARRHDCSEIVMGTRGQGRIKGMLMGSVALKVVHLTRVPVTLVK
jgi:nucleotide-binding universal stress UspA family protein